jgi:hypothetical protein
MLVSITTSGIVVRADRHTDTTNTRTMYAIITLARNITRNSMHRLFDRRFALQSVVRLLRRCARQRIRLVATLLVICLLANAIGCVLHCELSRWSAERSNVHLFLCGHPFNANNSAPITDIPLVVYILAATTLPIIAIGLGIQRTGGIATPLVSLNAQLRTTPPTPPPRLQRASV